MSNRDQLTEFTLLWTQAQPTVMAFIRSVSPQLADAEDILQETARQIADRFEEYDPARPFGPWAMGVAKYKVKEWRRKQKKLSMLFDDDAIDAIHFSYAGRKVDRRETGRAIEQCMQQASPAAERLLEMRYIEDLKPAEIARRTDTTANSVSFRLSRARDALKECLEKRLKEVEA